MTVPAPANGWEILNAIAQSIGALGTTGALIVAAFAYRRQVWDRRREQASQVTAERKNAEGRGLAVVRNHSALPIARIRLRYATNYGRENRDVRVNRRAVPPGGALAIDLPVETWTVSWVEFTDSAGRKWRRDSDGKLLAGPLSRYPWVPEPFVRYKVLDLGDGNTAWSLSLDLTADEWMETWRDEFPFR